MFAPRAQHRPHFPHALTPVVLAVIAMLGVIVAWAVFMARPTGDEAAAPIVHAGSVRSIAYAVSEGSKDVVYVEPATGGPAQVVAKFDSFLNFDLRGTTSPDGSTIAVLRREGIVVPASLVLINPETTSTVEVHEDFDYLSTFAWSRDGSRLALTRLEANDATEVVEVSTGSGEVSPVARFNGAQSVAPVGYSVDGERLYVVVIDQGGSTLWEREAGRLQRVMLLSTGPTRDWSLSPDGSRLAFVDRLGAGERSYAARIATIATGTVRDAAESGDQLGVAWRSGSPLPEFGGPEGTLQLTGNGEAYVIPHAFAPDGDLLVATIFAPARPGEPATESLEIVTAERRDTFSTAPRTQFLGWVRDLQ